MKKILLSLFLIVAVLGLLWQFLAHQPTMEEAYQSYKEGETATTISARKSAFNKSLSIYNQLDKTYNPEMGNGKLQLNLGNTYFQLEEYPLALYYYYKAQQLRPHDKTLAQNIQTTLLKLNLKPQDSSFLPPVFTFSLPMRLRLFFFSALALLATLSAYIWYGHSTLKNLIFLFSLSSLLFLGSAFYSRYLSPAEAVVIESVMLYRDAGFQYARVKEEPVPAGTVVKVIEPVDDGKWLKISADGTLGFVPWSSLKLL